MKKLFLLSSIALSCFCYGQAVSAKIEKAFKIFENDSQLKSAISSLYIIDAKTGTVVFDENSSIGLATASTLKIITAATAYELLGKNFSYKTAFGYVGKIEKKNLAGSLYINGSGDPTLGSWRWKQTSEEAVVNRITSAVKNLGINTYSGLLVDATGWESETIPDGWMWQDIGNYYGAGAEVLNWRENQYDLILKSGNTLGDTVAVLQTIPLLYSFGFTCFVKSAAKGTGDNSYIYLPINSSQAIVRGTIPIHEEHFIISGAMPSGRNQFIATITDSLSKIGIQKKLSALTIDGNMPSQQISTDKITIFHTEQSPPLDSIIYWFLKKSINLYGEALVKTMASQKKQTASTDNGVAIVKKFWSENGIAETELNIVDGSGLSPLNRVTTHAQVTVLQYAKKQVWYNSFYNALPEYNGMKMKSGTINGVKAFCGYQVSKNGHEYIFSFLVNNYNGSSATIVQKMYKVLDVLK